MSWSYCSYTYDILTRVVSLMLATCVFHLLYWSLENDKEQYKMFRDIFYRQEDLEDLMHIFPTYFIALLELFELALSNI